MTRSTLFLSVLVLLCGARAEQVSAPPSPNETNIRAAGPELPLTDLINKKSEFVLQAGSNPDCPAGKIGLFTSSQLHIFSKSENGLFTGHEQNIFFSNETKEFGINSFSKESGAVNCKVLSTSKSEFGEETISASSFLKSDCDKPHPKTGKASFTTSSEFRAFKVSNGVKMTYFAKRDDTLVQKCTWIDFN